MTVLFRHRARGRLAVIGLCVGLTCACLLALGFGAVSVSPGESLAILFDRLFGISLPWQFDDLDASVLLAIRLPRVVLGCLVGASLAMSGAALQGMFRNPLADPTLIGVSSGAALAVALAIVFGHVWLANVGPLGHALALPVAALAGGWVAVILVWRMSTRHGQTSVISMLLAGIAINSLAAAGIGLCIYAATDAQLRDLSFWTLGSLNGASWPMIAASAPLLALPLVALPRLARSLNALVLGEHEAGHLGIRADRVKQAIVALTALSVGTSVAMTGVIGFVGLLVPHMFRIAVGPDHRALLPGSALLGALLVVSADVVARTAVAPADLPIGVVTALVGAPVFVWLLVRSQSGRLA